MHIEQRRTDQVIPYERNPRKNAGAISAVAGSITEFGFRQPIVVDESGVIIVGHTRWLAAKQLGLETVPVHVAVGLDPTKAKAYRIADNATADLSSFDMELLPLEIKELEALDFNLELLGFPDDQLADIMASGNPGLTDPDEVPEPPDEAVTQPGDLWVLGNHRLLCGDSSKPEDLDRLLNGARIHICNSDPPYNVNVEPASGGADTGGQRPGKRPLRSKPSWRSLEGQRARGVKPPAKNPRPVTKTLAKGRRLAGDFLSDDEFARRLLAWFGNIARVLEPGRAAYIWGGYANIANYPPALKASGLYFSQCLIWVKGHPVITRKDFMGDHEWCFYSWREGKAHQFFGPNNVTDVWHVKKVNPQAMVHITEKPVELAARALAYSSKPGENVLDLFGGSGSTLIAAEQQGRNAFLMEIDALYSDIILQRWSAFTSNDPVLERTGETFSALKAKVSGRRETPEPSGVGEAA